MDALKILGPLCAEATHYSIAGFGEVMNYLSSDAPKRVRQRRQAFGECDGLRESMIEIVEAEEWPGTTRFSPSGLIFFGRLTIPARNYFLATARSVFWSAPQLWDDLSLYRNDRILYYTCTHEREGEIFGDQEMFANLRGARPKPSKPHTWRLKGRRIPPDDILPRMWPTDVLIQQQ